MLRPEVGGALAALNLGDMPILRTMPPGADHALQSACFPLVPFCNRIAHGRFALQEQGFRIAPNLHPHPHPLHGFGWLAPWHPIRSDADSALLEHLHDGSGEWPWPYRAHQHVALDETGCTIRLLVENRAPTPAPLGLGLHPYFRRRPETTVTFAAESMIGIDREALADGIRHPPDLLGPWSKGAILPPVLVDHCFTGWSGTATITDALGSIEVRGFGTPFCHVFAPPGEDMLCVEPVSHSPDALNQDLPGMPMVPPGCAVGIAMRIEAAGPG